ncbi:MAG TPA: DEAD/DEAH box helicase, partial [Sphingobacteriaceae bacterium]
MTSEAELTELDNELARLTKEYSEQNEEENRLSQHIAALRLELSKLRDRRFQVNQSIIKVRKNRDSTARKLELEREAALIAEDLEARRAEAAYIIATAPWRDDAYDWQIDGAIRLPDRALLGDKRGLGKTFSSLIWRRVKKSKRTLVCLRKEVASDFIKEIGIREPGLFVYNLIGVTPDQRLHAASLLNSLPDNVEYIVVTNIESWRRNIEKTIGDLLKIKFDAVILDEAHNIKNVTTGTAMGFHLLAHKLPKVLEMTGTPIKNRPQEMFSLLHALYPDVFPDEKSFIYDYCVIVGQNRWAFSESGLKRLVEKISHFFIARDRDDIGVKIPPPKMIEYKLDFESHPKQKKAYKEMTERSLAILESGHVLPIVSQLALMTRQAQAITWPAGIKFNIPDPETGEILETINFDVHESVKIDW